MADGALREHGKLLLFLCDTDLCKMLEMTDFGEDASDYLFELTDKCLMSIGR